jgi:hypothetical protein
LQNCRYYASKKQQRRLLSNYQVHKVRFSSKKSEIKIQKNHLYIKTTFIEMGGAIMNSKKQIKVIKRNTRRVEEIPAVTVKETAKNAKVAARDMAATVTNWVTEFQQKRRDETQKALNNLFPNSPQPANA